MTAASDWGDPAECKRVRPGLPGSDEDLFHQTNVPAFLMTSHTLGDLTEALQSRRLQRAIGVIYRPETERRSHYLAASWPSQFDAVIHVDRTRALEPLERTAAWDSEELPDTFPSGV